MEILYDDTVGFDILDEIIIIDFDNSSDFMEIIADFNGLKLTEGFRTIHMM